MRPYPCDLRRHALELVACGWSVPEVAHQLGISVRSIQRYRLRAARGRLAPDPIPGRTHRLDSAVTAALTAYVRVSPQATLDELRTWLRRSHGIEVSSSTVRRTLNRLVRRMPRPRLRPPTID